MKPNAEVLKAVQKLGDPLTFENHGKGKRGIIAWKPVAQTSHQNGCNCFDVAVGIDRKSLVEYALGKAESIEFRRLLAPEIRHAIAVTAVYLERKKFLEDKANKLNLARINRIIELFQIAEALEGSAENRVVEAEVVQLLDKAEKAIPGLTPDNLVDDKPMMKSQKL